MVRYEIIKKLIDSRDGSNCALAVEYMFKYSSLAEVKELIDGHFILLPSCARDIGFRISDSQCIRLSGNHLYTSALEMENGSFGEFLGNHPEYIPGNE